MQFHQGDHFAHTPLVVGLSPTEPTSPTKVRS